MDNNQYNGYPNNRNRDRYPNNGYYPRYDNYGGPGPQGYPPYQPQRDPMENPGFPFDIGQVVRHKTTNEELTVIRYGREQLECRLPNLTSQWFYVYELEAIESPTNGSKK